MAAAAGVAQGPVPAYVTPLPAAQATGAGAGSPAAQAQGLAGLAGTGVTPPTAPLTTVSALFDWAEVTNEGSLRADFLHALGDPGSNQTFAFIEADDFNDVLRDFRKPGDGETQVSLNPAEKARFRAAWRGARALVGLDSSSPPGTATPGAQAPGVGGAAAGSHGAQAPGGTVTAKKVKLSSLVDSTAEAELIPLDPRVLRDMYAAYEESRGAPPSPDVEPSADQLAALHQLLASGAAPYVCFSLFGPYGRRLLRKLTFIEHCYVPASGSWRRQELAGPPDYEAWLRCWLVFECAMLLLRQVKAERLRMYADLIRGFHLQYGPACWPIIYQADVRMRSEQFDRIRRGAEIAAHRRDPRDFVYAAYDQALPWDGVFAIAVTSTDYWDKEVEKKAMLFLTRVRSQGNLLSDGTAQDFLPGPPTHPGAPGGSAAPKKKKNGGGSGPGRVPPRPAPAPAPRPAKKAKTGGAPSAPHDVCRNWNSGGRQDSCPNGRRRACLICGGPHRATACDRRPGSGGGGGGGKVKAQ